MGPTVRIHIPNHHERSGNSYGYARTADGLRRALNEIGAAAPAEEAQFHVHVTPPHLFRKLDGAPNALFTMFEAECLPAEYLEAALEADLTIVPSLHNQRLFIGFRVHAELCPLGVDPALFAYTPRLPAKDGQRFRFLWVGAPNSRKGWPILDRAWSHEFIGDDRVELYVKTNSSEPKMTRRGNIIADSRNIRDSELGTLYASAHCFVFPTFGEGFGLTLAEAMATGLPSIFTNCGGVTDFADDTTGYPIEPRPLPVEYFGPNIAWSIDYRLLASRMRSVVNDYSVALAKGCRSAEKMRAHLTWRHAALRLLEITQLAIAN